MKITKPTFVATNTASQAGHHKLASFISNAKSTAKLFTGLPKAFVKGVSGQDDFTKEVKRQYKKN